MSKAGKSFGEEHIHQLKTSRKIVHFTICLSRNELYKCKYEAAHFNIVREIPMSESEAHDFYAPAIRLLARMCQGKPS